MDNNVNEIARALEQSVRDTIKNEILSNLNITIEKDYDYGSDLIWVKLYYKDLLVSEGSCYAN